MDKETEVPKYIKHSWRLYMENILKKSNSLEYLHPTNEISVCDIPMSKRLQNILKRYNILYLSQLSSIPKEKILMLRNMGKRTMIELDNICQKYGIQIHSLSSIKKSFVGYRFPNTLYEIFFQNGIFCVNDFKQKSADDLYIICKCDYILTMNVYYVLKENGVMFNDWQDQYIFELLSKPKAISIWQRYKITRRSQFSNCSEAHLKKVFSMFPELSIR